MPDYVNCGVKSEFICELSKTIFAIRIKMGEYGHEVNVCVFLAPLTQNTDPAATLFYLQESIIVAVIVSFIFTLYCECEIVNLMNTHYNIT